MELNLSFRLKINMYKDWLKSEEFKVDILFNFVNSNIATVFFFFLFGYT